MKKAALAIAFGLFLYSCTATSGASSAPQKNQISITDTKWELDGTVKGKIPTLEIAADKINGHAGCNSYFGQLQTNPALGSFSATSIGSTKMACDNLTNENNFLKALSEADHYTVRNNQLELYRGELLLLKFHRK